MSSTIISSLNTLTDNYMTHWLNVVRQSLSSFFLKLGTLSPVSSTPGDYMNVNHSYIDFDYDNYDEALIF